MHDKSRWRHPLVDPTPAFKALARVLGPVRRIEVLLWPLSLLAIFALADNWYDLIADTTLNFSRISVLEKIFIGMITVNLMSRSMQGIVINYMGGHTKEFGVQFVLGILPRFYVSVDSIKELSYKAQKSCYASTLKTRLGACVFGILGWVMLRSSGSSAADIMLVLAQISFAALFFTANPLFPADGYNWMCAHLRRPRLREDGFRVMRLVLSRQQLPAALGTWEKWALIGYVVLSVGYVAAFLIIIIRAFSLALEARWSGTGVFLASILLAIMCVYIVGKFQKARGLGSGRKARGKFRGGERPTHPTAPDPDTDEFVKRVKFSEFAVDEAIMDDDALTARERSKLRRAQKGQLSRLDEGSERTLIEHFEDEPVEETQTEADNRRIEAMAARARTQARRIAATLPEREQTVSETERPRPNLGMVPGRSHDIADRPARDDQPAAMNRGGRTRPSEAGGGTAHVLDPGGSSRNWDMPSDPASGIADDGSIISRAKAGLGAMRARVGSVIEPAAARVIEPLAARAKPNPGATRFDEDIEEPTLRPPSGSQKSGNGDLGRSASPNIDALLAPKRSGGTPDARRRTYMIWAIVVTVVLFIALLPYPFRVGGEFTIEPVERAEVRARVSGEVLELLVKEGDWVTKGELMARLSAWEQEHDIKLREADIAQGRAELETLVEGHRPEEIALAQQRVLSAGVTADYSLRELERKRELFSRDVGAQAEVDLAEGRYEVAVAEQEVARASLTLTEAPPLESEIKAAEARIERNVHDLEYRRLQLEYANIRAVADGQIVTPLEQFTVGTYLPVGGLFAELEDNRTVLAELEIPETDVTEVEIGAEVELVLWSSPWESDYGEVVRISPKAEEKEFGRVVRVLVEVPNPDGRLATNITGHGKILAEERPVWEAFSRAFVRFFKIEIWSWLP